MFGMLKYKFSLDKSLLDFCVFKIKDDVQIKCIGPTWHVKKGIYIFTFEWCYWQVSLFLCKYQV